MDFIKENWNLIKDTLRTEYDLSDISYTVLIASLLKQVTFSTSSK